MRSGLLLLVGAVILLLVAGPWEIVSDAQAPPLPPRAARFGVYNWNVDDRAFPGGNTDRLNWGADRVAATGTKTIRVYIGARDIYLVNPPGVTDLAALAASPAYDRLFRDSRFNTYLLTVYSLGGMRNNWADGYKSAEYAEERNQIRRLGQYLLSNPAFAGKTFMLLNWEGDNAIMIFANKPSIWGGYIGWTEARAEGVRLARAAVASSQTKLYSGLEFNYIYSLKTGAPCGAPVSDPVNTDPLRNRCVIDYVAPRVTVDYYSYSAWQTFARLQENPNLILKEELKDDLELALERVRVRRPEMTMANLLVGEAGFERVRYGECRAADLIRQFFDSFVGENGIGVSYAIFWQIIDNSVIYGGNDERFGLYRTRNGQLEEALPGQVFRRAVAGLAALPLPACPTLRRPPTAWGVVDEATGVPSFRLNPDSALEITSDVPFSAANNIVNISQNGAKFVITGANNPAFSESPSRITASLPPGRRPGEAWVFVSNAEGLESNVQSIDLQCSTCPIINSNDEWGIVNSVYQTAAITLGSKVSIYGSFPAVGNTVYIEQRLPGNIAQTRAVPKNDNWKESGTQIDLRVPTDLLPNKESVFYVVDAEGRTSNTRPVFLGEPCAECGPELRVRRSILNGETLTFHPGTFTSIYGYFPGENNRVVIEQWDEQEQMSKLELDSKARGFEESETMIRVGLPAQIHPGRAIIYVVDSEGRETLAREIIISPSPLAVVSAASYRPTELAPGSIAAAFGTTLAATTETSSTIPLPTKLAGTTIMVRDRDGIDHAAPLFFVSPQQVNFQIPEGTPLGPAAIMVTSVDGSISVLNVSIVTVAPGLFTANADGVGAASAYAIHVRPDDSQIYESTAVIDPGSGRYVTSPMAFGPESEKLYLAIYGTGWRLLSDVSRVSVTLGGVPGTVTYSGPQLIFVGLDQINLLVPRSMANRGEVDMVVTIGGLTTNIARVNFK
jgi:uncharacterized protein (TIGR03437 family)